MDWLTFFSKLVEHLAWPTTTLTLVLIFRHTIRDKLGDLVSANAIGVQAEFSKRLPQVKEDLERQDPSFDTRNEMLKAYKEVEEASKSVDLTTEDSLKDAINNLRILRDLVVSSKRQPTSESVFKYVALANQARASLEKLSDRERQVLELIVTGMPSREIADKLGISIRTVEAHRANIMEKANASTVSDLMNWYRKTKS